MFQHICKYFTQLQQHIQKSYKFFNSISISVICREVNKLQSLKYLDIFGVLSEQALSILVNSFPDIGINKFKHSAVARPTVGSRRTSIWGLRTRD